MSIKDLIVPVERIERMILLIRGQKVMLDSDLAELYGVETGALNRAVKRNVDRFPSDFIFQLTNEEFDELRCQFGISMRSQFATSNGKGGRQYRPYVFTEQGVAMLSSVLRSKRAVQVNIEIMRAFVKLRKLIASNVELSQKLKELERRIDNNEIQIELVFEAINQLMAPTKKKKNPLGFRENDK